MNEIIGKRPKKFLFVTSRKAIINFDDGTKLTFSGELTDTRLIIDKFRSYTMLGFPITHYEEREVYTASQATVTQIFWSGPMSHTFVWTCNMIPACALLQKTWRTA